MYKLFIFDWDGTLSDSTYHITSALQYAFERIGQIPPSDEQAKWVIGMSLDRALYHLAPDMPEDRIPDLVKYYKQFYFQSTPAVKLFEGATAMLQDLRSRGALLAVATGKSRYGLNQALEEQALQLLFDCTRTADETASKPNPLMLEEILQELDIPVSQAVMIGDTSHDIHMAKSLNMQTIAISHGAHSLSELQTCQAHHIVSNIPQLHSLLLSLFDASLDV